MRFGRHLLAACIATALAGVGTAFAQSPEPPSWILRYLSFYTNLGSNPPNIGEQTNIRLYGWYPYDCGGIRDWGVDDSGHIHLKLVKASDICGDTIRTWHEDFNLGFLPLGDHTVTVTRTFVNAARTDSVTESASFTFPVIDLGNPGPPPPPPGPPPPPNALVPYITGWFTIPSQPTALEATTLTLQGVFPYDCGEIADVVSDSGSVSFTMRPGPACSDTARSWSLPVSLGQLHTGLHVIHVTRRFVSADSNVVAEGAIGFYVWQDANTPPPNNGPREFPSVQARCLSGWTTHAPPTTHAPVWISLWGWFPYACGEVVDAQVVNPHLVTLRLRPRGGACADTSVMWSMGFDLGMLPAGPYVVEVILNVESDPFDPVVERHAAFQIDVDDREVSNSVPNPFVSDTRFTVSSAKAEHVDVGIYDLHGRRVKTVFRGVMAPGGSTFRWDGTRDDGSRAAIGIYFSRVAFSDRVATRKLVMLPR